MDIDPKNHLVIIKGKDCTAKVVRILKDGNRVSVTFNNGKAYPYLHRNVEYLTNPVRVPIQNTRVTVQGDIICDARAILQFGRWTKIFHQKGNTSCHLSSECSLQPMKNLEERSKDILAYYKDLADGTKLRTDDDTALLSSKFQNLHTVSKHTIFSRFLEGNLGDIPSNPKDDLPLIFPFSCNMSQKLAVQTALQNRACLIQGPPGTGKTQTILNLAANLLIRNMHIAVASNNNSAIQNVLKKLECYHFESLAAFLGSTKNRDEFVAKQNETPIQFPKLGESNEQSVRTEISRLNQELDTAFEAQNELARITQQIDAYRLESTHYDNLTATTREIDDVLPHWRIKLPAPKLLHLWLTLDRNNHQSFGKISELFHKIRILCAFGIQGWALLKLRSEEWLLLLRRAYYRLRIEELEQTKNRLNATLDNFRFDEKLSRLKSLSEKLLNHELSKRYNERPRKTFSPLSMRRDPKAFLTEYPIVLSTTFSIISCFSNTYSYVFDYVIVDEASQVDLLTGALTMACAKNLVVVGDPMQLPNVLSQTDRQRADLVKKNYDIPEYSHYEKHSLLSSIKAAAPRIPTILLREHYRCHPKIIQFCNQKFYQNELLIMTRDQGNQDVLKAYITTAGNHARGTVNRRQIDEITSEILPELLQRTTDIGIISPYREQVRLIRASIEDRTIEVDTVHKFQGREKSAIIISTVSNQSNDFVDNPNLFNVAVSRAQNEIRIIASNDLAEGRGNISDFIRYIQYQNCEIVPGRVRSVFDLLYSDYTEARLQFLRSRKRTSDFESEELALGVIEDILKEDVFQGYSVVTQFPLSMLIQDVTGMTPEEIAYAKNPWTRLDFLLYQKVDKKATLAIEVDGYMYHREGTLQHERDKLKNSILKQCGIPLLRLSTTGSNEHDLIRRHLQEALAG